MKRWIQSATAALICSSAAHAQIFTWTSAGDKVGNSDMASMVWLNSHGAGDTISAVAKLKARPAGMRCLFLWSDNHSIFNDPADQLPGRMKSLWWPTGIAKAAAAQNGLVTQLTSAGVKPDYIVLDNEDAPNRWNLSAANIAALSADSRGSALGVPRTLTDEPLGVQFDVLSARASKNAMQHAVFAPLLGYAPNAVAVQFADFLINAGEGQTVRDINNHVLFSDTLAGNTQNPAIYGSRGQSVQTQTPFGEALYSENILRITSAHGKTLPWYSGDNVDKSVWKGTNYWGESVRHGLLTCGLRGLLFDPDQATAAAKFSAIYLETKQAAGGTLPTTMCSTDIIDPSVSFFVTARADVWDGSTPANKVFGRVTFAPGVTSASFNVAGRDFTATPAAGQAGAWFSFTATTTQSTTTTTKTTTTGGSKPITPTRRTGTWFQPSDLNKRTIIPR